MSTGFKVKTHIGVMDSEPEIALRFWGGSKHKQTVRFAFPKQVMFHLKDVVVWGDDGSRTTLGALFDECHTCDFLNAERADDFLAWGSKHPQPADVERFLV